MGMLIILKFFSHVKIYSLWSTWTLINRNSRNTTDIIIQKICLTLLLSFREKKSVHFFKPVLIHISRHSSLEFTLILKSNIFQPEHGFSNFNTSPYLPWKCPNTKEQISNHSLPLPWILWAWLFEEMLQVNWKKKKKKKSAWVSLIFEKVNYIRS